MDDVQISQQRTGQVPEFQPLGKKIELNYKEN